MIRICRPCCWRPASPAKEPRPTRLSLSIPHSSSLCGKQARYHVIGHALQQSPHTLLKALTGYPCTLPSLSPDHCGCPGDVPVIQAGQPLLPVVAQHKLQPEHADVDLAGEQRHLAQLRHHQGTAHIAGHQGIILGGLGLQRVGVCVFGGKGSRVMARDSVNAEWWGGKHELGSE